MTSACYDVEITHRRPEPFSYGFAFRSRIWLIDLDEVPALPAGPAAGCADSMRPTTRGRSLRDAVEEWLAEHGIAAPERILMLGNPRVLGYVFNPLTVFYCLDARGAVSHVVAEVRNTYGGRHRYLLRPDADGTAQTDKAFYVSPFYPVDGHLPAAAAAAGRTAAGADSPAAAGRTALHRRADRCSAQWPAHAVDGAAHAACQPDGHVRDQATWHRLVSQGAATRQPTRQPARQPDAPGSGLAEPDLLPPQSAQPELRPL